MRRWSSVLRREVPEYRHGARVTSSSSAFPRDLSLVAERDICRRPLDSVRSSLSYDLVFLPDLPGFKGCSCIALVALVH